MWASESVVDIVINENKSRCRMLLRMKKLGDKKVSQNTGFGPHLLWVLLSFFITEVMSLQVSLVDAGHYKSYSLRRGGDIQFSHSNSKTETIKVTMIKMT
jgi:hypothetical protein